jgi:2-(1,2-epoxy-1,2-dihydrophenyl)acetyl-CoA isomerase
VSEETVLTERDGGVLTITLNRPDKLNALDVEMQRLVRAGLKEASDPEVRAVVLTGAGRGFCVGQDLNEFRDAAGDVATRLRTTYNENVLALRALEKPVIAAVNGAAAGAGMSLACACDVRIASEDASFVPAFIGIGLVPDTGGTWFVTQLLGYARAFEWLTSGRKLPAAEAREWGLANEVVPADGLAARVAEVAGRYAAAPTRGIGMTKRLLDRATRSRLEEQLEWEAQLQAAAAASEDFREGVAAFLEKREPRFTGR